MQRKKDVDIKEDLNSGINFYTPFREKERKENENQSLGIHKIFKQVFAEKLQNWVHLEKATLF